MLWSMSRNSMPACVIRDYNRAIDENGLPRFDYNEKGNSTSDVYPFMRGDEADEISTGQLAPPLVVLHLTTQGKQAILISHTSTQLIPICTARPIPTRTLMTGKSVTQPSAR